MGRSWRIARIAGIDIKVHVTFALVVFLGAWQWSVSGPRGALFGAVLTLAVFACIVLHELGHSVVAQAFGIPVKDITLFPLGGVAMLGKRPATATQELLIAIAGPVVNVVLATVLGLCALALFGSEALFHSLANVGRAPPTIVTFFAWLVATNGLLALFNLLPAFPMDGGRIFRALLTGLFGAERATRYAVVVARVVAVGLFGVGFFTGSFTLPLIAVFVFFSSGAEVRDTQLRGALEQIRSGDAVNPYVPRFTPGTTVGEAMQALVFTPWPAFAVEHFGRLVGVLSREALMRAAREDGASAYVAGVMDRNPPVIEARQSLEVARLKMNEAQTSYVAVVEEGLFLGLVTEAELAQQAVVAQRLQAQIRTMPGARSTLR